MNVGRGGVSESAEEIFHQFGLEIANARRGYFEFADAECAARKVERGGGETIVHGHQEVSGAENAAFRAECFLDGFAERDADVFHGVMLVNVEIAARGELQVESAVTRDLFEHVIEETNAGGDFRFAAPIEIQFHARYRFLS